MKEEELLVVDEVRTKTWFCALCGWESSGMCQDVQVRRHEGCLQKVLQRHERRDKERGGQGASQFGWK